jgi:pseudaminic acid biosynthesis-associated methylase
MKLYKTEQEVFWSGEFGNDYVERNRLKKFLPGRLALFSKILAHASSVDSVIEFGSNIGLNMHALSKLLPNAELSAIEINEKAVSELKKMKGLKVYHGSILDFEPDYPRDMAFTAGVLIHIAPEMLTSVYDSLYQSTKRYICVIEYYNPKPVELDYRGHRGKLFKRDFAGELLDRFESLQLIDYGFVYHRDYNFVLGDPTWFLLEKR